MIYFPTEYGSYCEGFLWKSFFWMREKPLWIKWENLNLALPALFPLNHSLFISNFVFYFPPRLVRQHTTLFALYSLILSYTCRIHRMKISTWKVHCLSIVTSLNDSIHSICVRHSLFTHMCICVQRRYPLNWYGDCFGVRNFEQQMNIHFKRGPMENGRRMKRASEWKHPFN